MGDGGWGGEREGHRPGGGGRGGVAAKMRWPPGLITGLSRIADSGVRF